jgi:hypothetical protein
MEMTRMFRSFCVVLLLTASLFAADFKPARVIDFQDASEIGGGTVGAPVDNGVAVTPTSRVPSALPRCEVVLELNGKQYTAIFPQDQHFQMTDLSRGQTLPIRIEGKKIAIQRPSDGKELKGKIVHEDPVKPAK